MGHDPFGAQAEVELAGRHLRVTQVRELERAGLTDLGRLPYSIRVLLENVLRHAGGIATEDHVKVVAGWGRNGYECAEIPFMPARVLLQDFTGVPCVVDLAAMREEVARMGFDPELINPAVPVDLVVDHSVQVDRWGTLRAYAQNVDLEVRRNRERYELIRWAQQAFSNLSVVPPGTGIVHQVNLEHLAAVVRPPILESQGPLRGEECYLDTVIGTDSHTPMVNGLGVLGWGVGGIEAEAVMLGQPYFMLVPEVVGVYLKGDLPPECTATDLVLCLTERLRGIGCVGRFVEYFGPGAASLSVADRATVANMAPEYGATCGFFPVDEKTLGYLAGTGRDPEQVLLVQEYCRLQGLFRDDGMPDPEYTEVVEFDLGEVEPSIAGPRRPQDRIPFEDARDTFERTLPALAQAQGRADTTFCSSEVCLVGEPEESVDRFEAEGGSSGVERGQEAAPPDGTEAAVGGAPADAAAAAEEETFELRDGAIVIAALTSCTNTSNPSVMLGAGLLARNAVRKGLRVPSWVKTSIGPGSRVVTGYLKRAGLLPYLEELGFHVVGYGCTTCIGNSGPLPQPIVEAIEQDELITASVLSGNRNFEARIHPLVRANYLASPLLVIAYAIAGSMEADLVREPLGRDIRDRPVYLRDIWPSQREIETAVRSHLNADLFRHTYGSVAAGDEAWRTLDSPEGSLFEWDPDSTYVQEPPFLEGFTVEPAPVRDVTGARILGIFGDSVTTDHISPASAIPADGPAGTYLSGHGVRPEEFNTFGSRRGNHEVMMRGTFANVRIQNRMLDGQEGGFTRHFPSGDVVSMYEAGMRYQDEGVPLVVVAGKEYGTGSSRDWAAKGTALLGVRAVIAESYERIHRSNLVGMGVLPLQFRPGENADTLGLVGSEVLTIEGLAECLAPGALVDVRVERADGESFRFSVQIRLDSAVDVEYYAHGGILPRVLRGMIAEAG